MSVSIEIVPSSSTLDMYGKQDSSSAYSLSGHIVLKLSSPSSIFDRARKSKLVLQSLELTFEGRSEVCGPTIGYTAARLCYITQELAPKEPLSLADDRQEESDEPCQWNVVFNMTVPGWLPETTSFGTEDAFGIKYKLYATAKFWNVGCRRDHSWSLSSLYSALCSPVRSVDAEKSILVRRFVSEPSLFNENVNVPNTTFYITPQVNEPAEGSSPHIPADIWNKIQILATVPEYTNVDTDDLFFTLRIRTKGLAPEECKRIQFMGFSLNILQREKCRERVTQDFKARYPIPPPLQQPPFLPLRDSHQLSYLYDSLYVPLPQGDSADSRIFSVLSSASNGKYETEDDTRVFSNDSEDSQSWYTLKCSIPLTHVPQDVPSCEWAGNGKLRPTISSPLLSIRHQFSLKVTLKYDLPDSDGSATEAFTFSVPLRFERTPPRLPQPKTSPLFTIAPPAGYAPILPAYSTLFDINGDRKIDPTPLPLYSPPGEPSPSFGEQVLAHPSDCSTIMDDKVCDLPAW